MAQKVEAKHRVLYELLVMVGVDEEIASRDACKMEHGLGEESFWLCNRWSEILIK